MVVSEMLEIQINNDGRSWKKKKEEPSSLALTELMTDLCHLIHFHAVLAGTVMEYSLPGSVLLILLF